MGDRGLRKDGDFGQPPPASHDGSWYEHRVIPPLSVTTVGIGLFFLISEFFDDDNDDDSTPGGGSYVSGLEHVDGNRWVAPKIADEMVVTAALLLAGAALVSLWRSQRSRHA
jgi:hypothetical protein